ncbi:MAG: biopolymer transporter ExbD [Nannocystaceae bacterium]
MSLSRLGQLGDEPGEEQRGLDITPLIDIVFILLIFASSSRPRSCTTWASTSSDRRPAPRGSCRPSWCVAISERGEITVDGRATPVSGASRPGPDRLAGRSGSVLLIADRGVHADRIVALMDACRSAGAGHIALAVEAAP